MEAAPQTPTAAAETDPAAPDWLIRRRRQALEQRGRFDHPTGREEAWRYTDVSVLRPDLYYGAPEMRTAPSEAARDHWITHNGCSGGPTDDPSGCQLWSPCTGGSEVMWCELEGVDHIGVWMSAFPVTDVMWSFFARHAR